MIAPRVTPRIRIVVVDYNGGDLTFDCLEHLVASEHPADALDIVLVDNGSQDPVAKRVRAELPSVRVVESTENRGFAGGCNLGIGDLRDVDHVALVNSDASVSPDWLRPLLDALDQDPGVGAASPKILLARRYRSVDISVPTARRRGDRRDLGVRITGARAGHDDVWGEVRFPTGTFGAELDRDGTGLCWTTGIARVLVPAIASPAPLELRLDAPRAVEVTFTADGRRTSAWVGPDPVWCAVPGDGAPFDVVNNVGTQLVDDGYAADRGWLERDRGQYERPEDVFAWCGAAVLLRADYLPRRRDVRRAPVPLLGGRRARVAGARTGVAPPVRPRLGRAPRPRGHRAALGPDRDAEGAQPAAGARASRPARAPRPCAAPVRADHRVLCPARPARARPGRRTTAAGSGQSPDSSLRGLSVVGSGDGAIAARGPSAAAALIRLKARPTTADTRPDGHLAPAADPADAPRTADHG